MKRSLAIAAIVAFSVVASTAGEHGSAGAAYPDSEASKHVGEVAVVTGKVVAVGASKQGNVYLNFGEKYPKQIFSGVVKAGDAAAVGDTKQYEGRKVAISGKIELYNEKPQIAITSAEQIQLAE